MSKWMPGLPHYFFIGVFMKRLLIALLMVCVLGVVAPVVLIAAESVDTVKQDVKVSLNAGSVVDFQALPGIGEVTAERIVAFRDQNGPFGSVDDLVKVKGVGAKTLEKIRSMLEL